MGCIYVRGADAVRGSCFRLQTGGWGGSAIQGAMEKRLAWPRAFSFWCGIGDHDLRAAYDAVT